MKTVAAPAKSECCMSKDGAKEGAAVKTVAATEKKEGCCSAKGETACKNGTDGCTGSGENGCCGKCAGEKKAEGTVATSGK